MLHSDKIDVIAEACIEANELIQAYGTPTMQALSRMLLFEIGQEIARHQADAPKEIDET